MTEQHDRGVFEGNVVARLDSIQATVERIENSYEPRLSAVEQEVRELKGGIKTSKWLFGAAVSLAGFFGYTLKH